MLTSSVRPFGNHLKAVSQEIHKISLIDISLKIIHLTSQPHLPVINELLHGDSLFKHSYVERDDFTVIRKFSQVKFIENTRLVFSINLTWLNFQIITRWSASSKGECSLFLGAVIRWVYFTLAGANCISADLSLTLRHFWCKIPYFSHGESFRQLTALLNYTSIFIKFGLCILGFFTY